MVFRSPAEKGTGLGGRIGRVRPVKRSVGYDQTGTFDPECGKPVGLR